MKQIRVGMIGAGGISHIHAKHLLQLKNVIITAVVDPLAQNRRELIGKHNLREVLEFNDYKEMLEKVALDAVVICSPHTWHFVQAKDCLNACCHVLVEKPMTCSSEEAKKLMELAERKNKILQVSYQRHYMPEFLFIKNCIENGTIGRLTSINASLYQDWKQLTEHTWRQNPSLSGGGMLMDSGSHIIDVILWSTGLEPEEVKTNISLRECEVEINSFTTIKFTDGTIGSLNIVGDAPCWYESYVFCGESGAIFYDMGKITVRQYGKEPMIPNIPEPTTNPDKNFIDTILGHKPDDMKGEIALKVIQFTESVYRAGNYLIERIGEKK